MGERDPPIAEVSNIIQLKHWLQNISILKESQYFSFHQARYAFDTVAMHKSTTKTSKSTTCYNSSERRKTTVFSGRGRIFGDSGFNRRYMCQKNRFEVSFSSHQAQVLSEMGSQSGDCMDYYYRNSLQNRSLPTPLFTMLNVLWLHDYYTLYHKTTRKISTWLSQQ